MKFASCLRALAAVATLAFLSCFARAQNAGVTYEGTDGPGKGKHIVFVTGDNEYRSEESMPQLAKILAKHHGFTCTVLFAINKNGEIDPDAENNIPGLEALDHADLMVLFTRFRQLPKEQMEHILKYVNSGKPIVALRTATHPFSYPKDSEYWKWSWNNNDGPDKGGFGRQVLGETWVNHWGHHQVESTRGIPAPGEENHPILRGVHDVWGESDVYEVTTLSGDSKPILLGEVLTGMNPSDPPKPNKKMMPVAWVKSYTGTEGKTSRIFTTTMGAAGDLKNEGFRRMMVNACYWALGMEDKISPTSNVDLVGEYNPTHIGFGKGKKGVKPEDHKW